MILTPFQEFKQIIRIQSWELQAIVDRSSSRGIDVLANICDYLKYIAGDSLESKRDFLYTYDPEIDSSPINLLFGDDGLVRLCDYLDAVAPPKLCVYDTHDYIRNGAYKSCLK